MLHRPTIRIQKVAKLHMQCGYSSAEIVLGWPCNSLRSRLVFTVDLAATSLYRQRTAPKYDSIPYSPCSLSLYSIVKESYLHPVSKEKSDWRIWVTAAVPRFHDHITVGVNLKDHVVAVELWIPASRVWLWEWSTPTRQHQLCLRCFRALMRYIILTRHAWRICW